MSIGLQTKVQASPAQNSPVQTGLLQRKCTLCNTPGLVEDSERDKEKLTLQRSSVDQAGTITVPPIVHEVLRSPGQPLDAATRAFMEPRFGHDFSKVRVHTDARAAKSTRAVNALAYSVGPNVVFGEGQYVPTTDWGLRLLTHELTHVIQQSQSGPSQHPLIIGSASSSTEEVDAVRAAALMDAGSNFHILPGTAQSGLQKKSPEKGPKHELMPLCPEVGDPKTQEGRRRALCVSDEMKKEPPDCRFTERQKIILRNAKREAKSRVRRAYASAKAGKEGALIASEFADELFKFDPPSAGEVNEVLRKVEKFLRGSGVEFAAKGCGEPECHSGATSAYVTAAGTMPIYICPFAFAFPDTIYKTIIHETLHWSGLDADPNTPEGYCGELDCATPCLTKKDADAWAHYLDCLGEPLKMRRSFREKILESVHEIP